MNPLPPSQARGPAAAADGGPSCLDHCLGCGWSSGSPAILPRVRDAVRACLSSIVLRRVLTNPVHNISWSRHRRFARVDVVSTIPPNASGVASRRPPANRPCAAAARASATIGRRRCGGITSASDSRLPDWLPPRLGISAFAVGHYEQGAAATARPSPLGASRPCPIGDKPIHDGERAPFGGFLTRAPATLPHGPSRRPLPPHYQPLHRQHLGASGSASMFARPSQMVAYSPFGQGRPMPDKQFGDGRGRSEACSSRGPAMPAVRVLANRRQRLSCRSR